MRRLIIAGAMILASASATGVSAYNSAVDALIDQARQHLVQGDFERADLVAQRIVRIDPEDARGWGLMAEILEAQGNHDEARQYRSRQRLASRQLNDGEGDYINRNGTGQAVAAGSAGSEPAGSDRYGAPEQQSTARTDSQMQGAAQQPIQSVEVAEEKPTPPVDGWEQSKQMRPQNREVADSNAETQSGRTGAGSTSSSADQERVAAQSKQSRVRAVFASSGAYAERERQSRQHTPARQSHSQHQYSEREISQLERMRRHHRKQVSRLHRKLFGRDDGSERRARQPARERVAMDTTDSRRSGSSYRVGSNDHNRSTASLVPAGYYPPPGSCRIWYYDLAPDQQPPSGSCQRLRSQLPVGARLLKGA